MSAMSTKDSLRISDGAFITVPSALGIRTNSAWPPSLDHHLAHCPPATTFILARCARTNLQLRAAEEEALNAAGRVPMLTVKAFAAAYMTLIINIRLNEVVFKPAAYQDVVKGDTTRSPTLTVFTLSPAAITSPVNS